MTDHLLLLNQYQVDALSTAIYPPQHALAYTTLGLCGEVGEIASKVVRWRLKDSAADCEDALGELGDVCWYIATSAHVFGIALSELNPALRQPRNMCLTNSPDQVVLRMAAAAGEVANKAKKVIRDGRPIEQIREHQVAKLGELLAFVSVLAAEAGLTLDQVMKTNTEKLRSRMQRKVIGGDGDKR